MSKTLTPNFKQQAQPGTIWEVTSPIEVVNIHNLPYPVVYPLPKDTARYKVGESLYILSKHSGLTAGVPGDWYCIKNSKDATSKDDNYFVEASELKKKTKFHSAPLGVISAVFEESDPKMKTLAQVGSVWVLKHDIPVYAAGPANQRLPLESTWILHTTIPSGTEVTVASKQKKGASQLGRWLSYSEHLWVDLKTASGDLWTVKFSDFNHGPMPKKVAEAIPVYGFRDTVTQLWYAECGYSGGISYADKFTKARQFKRLADARQHLLVLGGYYENLPDTNGLPEWMRCDRAVEFPKTFEIVEIDKIRKVEMKCYETDKTLERSWKLRGLTVAFGSAVRAMYKKLEDKEELGTYPFMLVFKPNEKDLDQYWDYEMSATEIDAIKTLAANMGKTNCKLIKHQSNVCLAVKTEGASFAAQHLYAGALEASIINVETLLAVVPTATSTMIKDAPAAPYDDISLPDNMF